MSDIPTDNLIELALELEEYWQGTPHADLIRADLDAQDYEALRHHVVQAHKAQFDAEFAPRQADVH
jgi:hypothetical protein